jgi:hypothetical protein
MNTAQIAGSILVLSPVLFNVLFILLQKYFEYPSILRKPTEYVLQRFSEGGRRLIAIWYCFTLTPILFVALVEMIQQVFSSSGISYLGMATTFGVLAGAVQFLGLIRWPFLVPYLAKTYRDPTSSQATRDSVVVIFQATNRYLGVAVGEHLGYLFTGVWTILTGLTIINTSLLNPLLGWLGIFVAFGIAAGILEEVGFRSAGAISAISYVLWSSWLIVIGLFLLLS